MSDNRSHVLPIYLAADESRSMARVTNELNAGVRSLHEALLVEPMAAAKVRFSVLGFSDDVIVHLRLSDLREGSLPALFPRGKTNYGAVFRELSRLIPRDVSRLRREGYAVYRPTVFFLSDGKPTDKRWEEARQQLVDRNSFPAAPNIIACGVGSADAETILKVASRPEYAFVAIVGSDVGAQVAKFCTALTTSVVRTGRSATAGQPELVVDRPSGFRLAIDVI